ncbi:alpha/beta hydrolase [Boseaceae bacterium BT-24-1]|nr:alpha/beta hydrolase [Boseaceae bacterium BT-24-1]
MSHRSNSGCGFPAEPTCPLSPQATWLSPRCCSCMAFQARNARSAASFPDSCLLIAPDLPGYGQSAPLPVPTFDAFGTAIQELLDPLAISHRLIYLPDWGAPVGLDIAMRSPEQVSGLIIQNANAHRSGFGPLWQTTFEFWANPTAENEAKATSHLTFKFTREQYTGGLPEEVAARIKGEPWIED